MVQSIHDKAEALKTLLPLLTAHLALIPGARIVPRYGDAERDPGPPPPPWSVLDCDGACPRCEYDPATARGLDRCRGEGWERMAAAMDCCHRLGEVRRVYRLLEEARPWMHRAVRLVYVEPWDERSEPISEPARIMRARVAEDGVEWMAGEVRGDLVALGEKAETRANAVARLASYGYTQRRIAKELRCSLRDVTMLLAARESATRG